MQIPSLPLAEGPACCPSPHPCALGTGACAGWFPAPTCTFTAACLPLLRSHSSCKRSSTCLELKSWTLPPRPALLTYHFAITCVSLSCSFSPGLGFPNTFPCSAPLSPLLIKHGLDAISQLCLLHLPSIDYFLGAPTGGSPSTFDLPRRKQSPNVRRLSATQQCETATSALSHFTDRKKKCKTWSEKLQRKEIKIQHSNFTAPPLLRAACASLKHSSLQVFAMPQPTSFPILWKWWSFLSCTLTGREKSWQLNGILQIHHHLSCLVMTIPHTPARMRLALHTSGLRNLWSDLHLCSFPIFNAFRAEHGKKKEKKPEPNAKKLKNHLGFCKSDELEGNIWDVASKEGQKHSGKIQS